MTSLVTEFGIPHVESSFGELFWRALLESFFGGTINLFDFTCQNTKFNSIFWIFYVKQI